MSKIKVIKISQQEELENAFSIRKKVFVEEQGVDPALEYDEHEKTATHYLAFYNDTPAGTARWRKTENGIKLERFAVLHEYRNKGLGEALLRKVLDDVLHFNLPVYLHSQLRAYRFYKKHGFEISGDKFIEADIEHYKMVLKK